MKGYLNIFVESWREMIKYKQDIENNNNKGVSESVYEVLIERLKIELEIGKGRKEKKINDNELLKHFKEKYDLDEEYEVIYTDGSFKKGRKSTGIGTVREDSETTYNISINPKCSSYSAEVIAIEKTISMAIELGWDRDILILTDCQGACKDLRNNRNNVRKHSSIVEIREKIAMYEIERVRVDKKVKRSKIVIGWIPSHAGIKDNEIADKLAKEAVLENPDNRIKVPISDSKRIYR